jgi:hypothetical protein
LEEEQGKFQDSFTEAREDDPDSQKHSEWGTPGKSRPCQVRRQTGVCRSTPWALPGIIVRCALQSRAVGSYIQYDESNGREQRPRLFVWEKPTVL